MPGLPTLTSASLVRVAIARSTVPNSAASFFPEKYSGPVTVSWLDFCTTMASVLAP